MDATFQHIKKLEVIERSYASGQIWSAFKTFKLEVTNENGKIDFVTLFTNDLSLKWPTAKGNGK